MIKELLGKNREREEDAYVYTQEEERKEIMEMSVDYVNKWKQPSFPKKMKGQPSHFGMGIKS